MRVLFLTLYPDVAASSRYRVTQFVPYLERNGISCTVASPLTAREFAALTGPRRRRRPFWYHCVETFRRVCQILDAAQYDVVFVQKTIMTAYVRGLPRLLRSRARCIVYDIDDAVHLAPPHPLNGVWRFVEDRDQITDLFSVSDLVLAGNAWLAEQARAAGGRVVVFPTVVDTDRFVPAAEGSDVYRIGWVGNPSTTICLEPAMEAVAAQRSAKICFIGADSTRVPWGSAKSSSGADAVSPVSLEFRPWRFEHEVTDLQSFSVGIMPQPNQEWMRGKCALKALQYMACGIPCVASPFGAVLDIIQHGDNGLLAQTTQEWLDAFDRLRDAAERRRIGEAGRATVEAQYSLRDAAPRLLQLLESLA